MTVRLVSACLTDDLTIVNGARASFGAQEFYELLTCRQCGCQSDQETLPVCPRCQSINVETILGEANVGRIYAFMRERHGGVFEHVTFRFAAEVPIGEMQEWRTHRIGSFSAQSSRYKKMTGGYYIPQPEDVRRQIGKAMSYQYESIQDPELVEETISTFERITAECDEAYNRLIDRGVARECARDILPLATMTSFTWTVNLRSLFNFISLRTAPNALVLIRRDAEEVERLATTVVPVAMAAFNAMGRMAP